MYFFVTLKIMLFILLSFVVIIVYVYIIILLYNSSVNFKATVLLFLRKSKGTSVCK